MRKPPLTKDSFFNEHVSQYGLITSESTQTLYLLHRDLAGRVSQLWVRDCNFNLHFLKHVYAVQIKHLTYVTFVCFNA